MAFLICVIMCVMGVVFIIVDIPFNRYNDDKHSLFHLGMVSVLCAIWCMTETQVLQLLIGKSAWIHIINYLSLMLLPYPTIKFISSMFGFKNNKFISILCGITLADCIMRILLNAMGIMDYHQTLKSTQLVVLAVIVMLIIQVTKVRRQKFDYSTNRWIVYMGFMMVIVTAVIDMIRYSISVSSDNAAFTRIGMMFAIMGMGIYIISNMTNAFKHSYEVKFMKKLAYTDALTGLGSRAAYIKYMDELECNKVNLDCIAFIQFDINNLKPVNDNYGHIAGDQYIIECAELLANSFNDKARCFRTGGDEFVVIIVASDAVNICERAIKNMNMQLEEINGKKENFDMHIAHGTAYYMNGDTSELYDLVKKADMLMYENKRSMKEI